MSLEAESMLRTYVSEELPMGWGFSLRLSLVLMTQSHALMGHTLPTQTAKIPLPLSAGRQRFCSTASHPAFAASAVPALSVTSHTCGRMNDQLEQALAMCTLLGP